MPLISERSPVREAIAYCRKHEVRKLVFERGRYDFKHPSFLEQYDQVMKHGAQMDLGQALEQKSVALRLEDMCDFEWDGGDSEFVFHGLVQPFACLRCRSLKLHYARPQGLQPGMHLVMRHLMNYRMGILFYECSGVQVYDVTLHYIPGMGIIGHRSENLAFTRLKVKPGIGRVLSTNTDATHFISCKGEISFTACSFEGMGDDAVNVHGFYIIYGRGGLGLRIQSAEDVIVADNQFNGCSQIAELDHSRHIRFRGNRYDRDNAGIAIGEGCVDKTIELGDEQ
ncbi:right-handed parallel beta-helix repeat-containing protein [Paenibacillus sp. J5C_2022]|uniref:right-handed parallel beta-helix repeat-containing protein n=1 Tax=Paenibacillus sp. J5C2022 TaxID=2977129 RepID=UPI0021D1FFAE|nr:right-handed parallel beta-helix repeat-containing protein [Paenibacillus sp. J5C2022]MCU6707744.1 right-handed parallel beta-helix repeat-containing protein [Paenibacillus sp. J5C2022]